MSIAVSVSGTSYLVPVDGDSGWATDVTNLLVQLATATKVLQVTSSSFPLLQDLSFGTSFGLKTQYIKSQATNPSATGVLRLGNAETIKWRNAANTADLALTVSSSDVLNFNGANILIPGIGSIVNADISASAAIAYSKLNLSTSILNSDINASAAIALSKLAALTASRVAQTNGTGALEASAVTNVELGYVSGVTSSIQTQITAKQDASTAVTLTGVQTLTNKTLTSPVIAAISNTGTLTLPTSTDTLVGRATTDTLTNKSLSALTNTISNISDAEINASAAIALSKLAALTVSKALVSDASGFIAASAASAIELGYLVGVSSAIQTQITAKQDASTAVTLTGVQTLTNKTLTSPTVNSPTMTAPVIDIETYTDQSSTPASPSAGKRKVYSKTNGKMYQLDSAGVETVLGSGGTGINFVSSGDAEGGNIFNTYKNTAQAIPVSGTGGTPTITAATTSATSPLSGSYSFLLTKPASNVQGEGWSYDLTIDAAAKAKVLTVSADYLISSGTFVAGSSGVDSDLEVYLYDVTNGVIIQPSSYKFLSNSTTIVDKFNGTFQTSSNSTSYRLIFHLATTSTAAFVMKMDSVSVSPSTYAFGNPITDWVTWTPTGSWTNTTYTGRKRRVGDTMEYDVLATATGSPAAGTLSISLTETIDTSKLALSTTNNYELGLATSFINASPGNFIFGQTRYLTSTTVSVGLSNAASTYSTPNTLTSTTPYAIASGDYVHLSFKAPIVGFGSAAVQMSDSADTRIVAAGYSTLSATAYAANSPIKYTTKLYDTHGFYNSATGTGTIPVTGVYRFTVGASYTVSGTDNWTIYKNLAVSATAFSQSTASGRINGSAAVSFNAGDTFSVGRDTSTAFGATDGYLWVERISGPSQIAASESVNAKYFATTGSTTSSVATVVYGTKVFDSHSAYNATTGIFTAPISGKYLFTANITSASTLAASDQWILKGFKNGTVQYASDVKAGTGAANTYNAVSVFGFVDLLAGETFQLKTNTSAATLTHATASGDNEFSIIRSGN